MDTNSLSLTETVRLVREQLKAATVDGVDEWLRFELGSVELTLQVQVTAGREGQAGLNIQVVNLGGKVSSADASTHTIKVTLNPTVVDERGRPIAGKPLVGSRVSSEPT